jgi:hypothetical protein
MDAVDTTSSRAAWLVKNRAKRGFFFVKGVSESQVHVVDSTSWVRAAASTSIVILDLHAASSLHCTLTPYLNT